MIGSTLYENLITASSPGRCRATVLVGTKQRSAYGLAQSDVSELTTTDQVARSIVVASRAIVPVVISGELNAHAHSPTRVRSPAAIAADRAFNRASWVLQDEERSPGRRVVVSVPRVSGVRLREARVVAGYTQQQLAEHLGVQQPHIAYWESPGYFTPSPSMLVRIAKVLRVEPDDLLEPGPYTLRRLRVTRGISGVALAEAAQMPVQTYRDLENGLRATLKPDKARRLAAALGVTVEEIEDAHARSRAEAESK